jgi:sortase A
MTKETTLLPKSVAKPYKPELPDRKFKEEAWIKLPEPGSQRGRLVHRFP